MWRGKPAACGYGRISIDNHVIYAHQAAWIDAAGPIPDGLFVCHTCDIRMCTRNDDEGTYEVGGNLHPRRGHLWLGTVADNQLDMALKGRGNNAGWLGSEHPNALLTELQVIEMRAFWATGEWTQVALGKRYGVTKDAIWRVLHGDNWSHVV